MKKMYAVENLQDFLAQVDDVIFDLEEMVACSTEDEGEELAAFAPHCQKIANCLRAMRDQLDSGSYSPGGKKELECMPLIREVRRALPFYPLLDAINTTYREGLATSPDT